MTTRESFIALQAAFAEVWKEVLGECKRIVTTIFNWIHRIVKPAPEEKS